MISNICLKLLEVLHEFAQNSVEILYLYLKEDIGSFLNTPKIDSKFLLYCGILQFYLEWVFTRNKQLCSLFSMEGLKKTTATKIQAILRMAFIFVRITPLKCFYDHVLSCLSRNKERKIRFSDFLTVINVTIKLLLKFLVCGSHDSNLSVEFFKK